MSALFLWCIFCLGLGCSSLTPPHTFFHDYLQRLGNVLDQDVVIEVPTENLAQGFPRRRLLLPTAADDELTINLLQWLKLSGCRLQTLVAKQNDGLARVAPASQQLIYEVTFLQWVPECIDLLKRDSNIIERHTLADELERVAQLKRQQLLLRAWQAMLGGPEWREFWARSQSIDQYPAATNLDIVLTLQWFVGFSEQLQRVSDGGNPSVLTPYLDQLETQLALLRRGDGGALLKAMGLQQHYLHRANQFILARIEARPLCVTGSPSQAAIYLDNVMRKFFIGRVQPWSAEVNRRWHVLQPAVLQLEHLLQRAEPEAYQQWRTQRDAWLQRAAESPKRHVGVLQQALQSCQLTPTE